MILNQRPIDVLVYENGTNITGASSITIGSMDDLKIDVIIQDGLNGNPVISHVMSYSVSNGANGSFSLVSTNYTVLLSHQDLTDGTWILSIDGNSPIYKPVSIDYFLTVQNIPTSINYFTSYQQVEHGFNLTLNFQYHDELHDIGITGASAMLNISGFGLLDESNFTLIDDGSGNYTLTYNTSLLNPGSYELTLSVSREYHENASTSGTLEIRGRKSRLESSNSSISGNINDDVGPISLHFYHPDYPSTINYTSAQFKIYLDSNLQDLMDPSNYSVTNMGDGYYNLILKTGNNTKLNTTGITSIYILGENSSSSPFHVSSSILDLSIIINKRAVDYFVFLNGTDITNETILGLSSNNSNQLNLTIVDQVLNISSSDYSIQFNLTNGNSGTFTYQSQNYTAFLPYTMFSSGTQVLSITGSSPSSVPISIQYFIIIQSKPTSISGFTNYHKVEHGKNLTIEFHYHDEALDTGILNANINFSITGIGQLQASQYELVDHLNGNYTIIFNTTILNASNHEFYIVVEKSTYTSQVMSGTIDVIERKSILEGLNGTLTCKIDETLGPVALWYHHTSENLNYTDAEFTLYTDSELTTIMSPSNYSINFNNGYFWLTISTGINTSLNLTGINRIYVKAINSSASTFYVAAAITEITIIIEKRPVNFSIFNGNLNISNDSSVVLLPQDDLQLDVSIIDLITGMNASDYVLTCSISSGINCSFSYSAGNYSTFISHENLTLGTWVLSISGDSPIHDSISKDYFLIIQEIPTSIDNLTSFVQVEHGFEISINFT
ncbi:MAG: hypothetical protein ACTSRA_05360 [Promethearchaeota archaeon]